MLQRHSPSIEASLVASSPELASSSRRQLSRNPGLQHTRTQRGSTPGLHRIHQHIISILRAPYQSVLFHVSSVGAVGSLGGNTSISAKKTGEPSTAISCRPETWGPLRLVVQGEGRSRDLPFQIISGHVLGPDLRQTPSKPRLPFPIVRAPLSRLHAIGRQSSPFVFSILPSAGAGRAPGISDTTLPQPFQLSPTKTPSLHAGCTPLLPSRQSHDSASPLAAQPSLRAPLPLLASQAPLRLWHRRLREASLWIQSRESSPPGMPTVCFSISNS